MGKLCFKNRNKSRTFFAAEQGAALIYVLIAVALFGFLTATVARQGKNTEIEARRGEEIALVTTEILTVAANIESAVEQMTFTGSTIDDLDFTQPGQAGFNTGSHIHKVFHPSGGGVTLPQLNSKAIAEINADPPAGWYIGRSNNVEWTNSTRTDVILTAHQIEADICAHLNKKLMDDSRAFPLSGGVDIEDMLVSDTLHGGTNIDMNTSNCADCEDHHAACISDSAGTIFSFYSIVLAR